MAEQLKGLSRKGNVNWSEVRSMSEAERANLAAYLRADANTDYKRADDSFDRCDTDGYLSQWADGVNGDKRRLEADLVEAGGVSTFLALFTVDGKEVNAHVIHGRYGYCWMIKNSDGSVDFAPYNPVRASTLAKRGYKEVEVERPARVKMTGTNLCNVGPSIVEDWSDLAEALWG